MEDDQPATADYQLDVELIITLLSLTAFDLITNLVIQTSLSYSFSVEEWHLLSISLGLLTTAWFWVCFFILFGCTVGMFVFVVEELEEETFLEEHLFLCWGLKDSVACNVIAGVSFVSRTSTYKALCRGLGYFFGPLWTGVCWLGYPLVFVGSYLWTGVKWAIVSSFHGVGHVFGYLWIGICGLRYPFIFGYSGAFFLMRALGHVLWSSCMAIYWVGDMLVRGIAAIISFSWTVLWMSRYILILALLILIFYAIQEHALHTHAAISEHASIVEESSHRIHSAVEWHGTTVSRTLDSHGEQIHRASLTLSNSLHSSSKAITAGMDRHSYTIDRSIRDQSREIQAAATNVVTGMHVAAERVYRGAELNGNLVRRAVIENGKRQQQQALLEGPRRERTGVGKNQLINTGLATVGSAATVVGAVLAASCNVM